MPSLSHRTESAVKLGTVLVFTRIGGLTSEVSRLNADSDETGHLFRSMSDSVPVVPDSYRSEATLDV